MKRAYSDGMPRGWSLRSGARARLAPLLDEARAWPFSYPEVGGTRTGVPRGDRVDVTEATLGFGATAFERSRALLRAWTPFEQPWLDLLGAEGPPRAGKVVLLCAAHGAVVSLHACRVVYVQDEPRLYAFAYGTLPVHAARGEERFEVCLHDDGRVTLRIVAFSRPSRLVFRLGWPVMRVMQRRFARGAVAVMRRRLADEGAAP